MITPKLSGFANPPAQAAAAGFTTLAFFDDFTNAATITGSPRHHTKVARINWYPGHGLTHTDPVNYHVLPTSTASQIRNGNTSGGSNASPNGGIVVVYGHPSVRNQANLQTIPQAALVGRGGAYSGAGTWGPSGYFESYVQFNQNSAQHLGFWLLQTPEAPTELDVLEYWRKWGTAYVAGTLHTWNRDPTGGDDPGTPLDQKVQADSQWHTWGILIEPIGSDQGQVSLWLDNVQVGQTLTVGTNTSSPEVLTGPYFFLIGKDFSADPFFCDWVRIWQPTLHHGIPWS